MYEPWNIDGWAPDDDGKGSQGGHQEEIGVLPDLVATEDIVHRREVRRDDQDADAGVVLCINETSLSPKDGIYRNVPNERGSRSSVSSSPPTSESTRSPASETAPPTRYHGLHEKDEADYTR
jgi:hypothetical protein